MAVSAGALQVYEGLILPGCGVAARIKPRAFAQWVLSSNIEYVPVMSTGAGPGPGNLQRPPPPAPCFLRKSTLIGQPVQCRLLDLPGFTVQLRRSDTLSCQRLVWGLD